MQRFTGIEKEYTRSAKETAWRSIKHFDPHYPRAVHLLTSSPRKMEGAAQAFELLGIHLPIQPIAPQNYIEPLGQAPTISRHKADAADQAPTRESRVAIAGAGFDGSVQIFDKERQKWVDLHRISRFTGESGLLTLSQIIARFNLLCRLLVDQNSLVRRVHSATLKNGRQTTISETVYQRVGRIPRKILSQAVERAVDTRDIFRFSPGVPLAELTQDSTRRVAFVPGVSSHPGEWYSEYRKWSEQPTDTLYRSCLRDIKTTFPAIVLLRGL